MSKAAIGSFYAGTSNIVLPVPNKQSFPPAYRDKTRLTYYSALLNSLEVNSSFYKMPRGATVKKWTEEVSANFVFTFKCWQEITHAKGFAWKEEDLLQFMTQIDQAGTHKGCLLVQFPPSLTVDQYGSLEALLSILQSITPEHGWKVALEFRHSSWYIGEVFELADEFGCSIVLHDIPKSANRQLNKEAAFVYLRFHGPTGDYRGSYSDGFLQQQALLIDQWRQEGKDVYAYFNNTIGDAYKNVVSLNSLVAAY